MLQKLLLIILVIFLVYTIIKMYNKPQIDHSKKKQDKPSDMVECKSCGTYYQEDDAIVQDGKHYCSNECAKSAK